MRFSRARIIMMAVIALGSVVVARGCYVARQSWEAEKTLHAFWLVSDILCAYIESSDGEWPTSWEDLVAVVPTIRGASSVFFRWPEDLGELRKRVRVDFGLSTADVASMDDTGFRAVEEIGPSFGPNAPAIGNILEVARRSVRRHAARAPE
jgi:hypothetical protein